MKIILAAACTGLIAGLATTPAAAQQAASAYTTFDSKKCQHTAGKDAEDYGSWRCAGYADIEVRLSAGDQRMQVSFGPDAAREVAARQTFPAFNSAYEGTVEWRLAPLPSGTTRPFATILRWNVRQDDDGKDASGRVLVVTRLGSLRARISDGEPSGPSSGIAPGICHVGYVDARANPDANALARKIADENARKFVCGRDRPVVLGKVSPGLAMPEAR